MQRSDYPTPQQHQNAGSCPDDEQIQRSSRRYGWKHEKAGYQGLEEIAADLKDEVEQHHDEEQHVAVKRLFPRSTLVNAEY